VWPLRLGEEKKKIKERNYRAKYNGFPITWGGHNKQDSVNHV